MAGTGSIKDRIRADYSTLLDNFANLVRAAKVRDPSDPKTGAPGDMLEVYAEKMLAAGRSLLATTSDLQRNVLLNDVAGRNAEVAAQWGKPWEEDLEGADGAEAEAEAMDEDGGAAAAGR